MKNKIIPMMLLVVMLQGCALFGNSVQRLATLSTTYNIVLEASIEARREGVIEDDTWDDMMVQFETGDIILDKLEDNFAAGAKYDPDLVSDLYDVIYEIRRLRLGDE